MKVLIVEDDQLYVELLTRIMPSPEYQLFIAKNCRQAYTLLASDVFFDIVLLDLGLPDGNGFDILYEIKKNHKRLVVVVMTTDDLCSTVIRAYRMGTWEYTLKTDIGAIKKIIDTSVAEQFYSHERSLIS